MYTLLEPRTKRALKFGAGFIMSTTAIALLRGLIPDPSLFYIEAVPTIIMLIVAIRMMKTSITGQKF